MKNKWNINLIISGMIFIFAGCAQVHYDKLPPLPEYPSLEATFNTSAVIQFFNGENVVLNECFLKNLVDNKYNLILNGDNNYLTEVPSAQYIIVPLSLKDTIFYCRNGHYLEKRLIVAIRRPGYIWDGKHYSPPSRFFQAFSRQFIPDGNITEQHHIDGTNMTVANLFKIPEFRQALEPGEASLQKVKDDNEYAKAHVDSVFKTFNAFQHGDKEAERLLSSYALKTGNIFGDNKRLVQYLLRIAPSANVNVQYKLASMYEGGCGIANDPEKAFHWFNIAAEGGLAEAQYKVAEYYEGGIFVSKDNEKAFYWFQKAGAGGMAVAQYKVGSCYEEGIGVKKNIPEAIKWYQKAAAQNHEEAMAKVDELADFKPDEDSRHN